MAYGFYTPITIESAVVYADHVNFPIMVKGTFDGTAGEADLRTVANGGNIENVDATGGAGGGISVPADFVFSPNNDGSSPYDFEFTRYNASTGEIIAFVEIPTMDASDDLILYMVYGDSGVTTSQEDVPGTWNSGYVLVNHLSGSSYSTCYESTGNHNFSGANSPTYQQEGLNGYGIDFSGTSQNIYISDRAAFDLSTLTQEVLLNAALIVHASSEFIFGTRALSGEGWGLTCYAVTTAYKRFSFDKTTSGGTGGVAGSLDMISDTNYYIASTCDSLGNIDMFINNVKQTESGLYDSPGTTNSANALTLGSEPNDFDDYEYNGLIEEIRLSNIDRGDEWCKTTYNNLMNFANFITFGSETGGSVAHYGNIYDNVGITDSYSNILEYLRILSEPVGVTDTLSKIGTFFKTFADSVGITDAFSTAVNKVISFLEEVGITDTISRVVNYFRNISEAVGAIDEFDTAIEYILNIADAVGITDAINNLVSIVVSISDSIGITDTISNVRGLVVAIQEGVSISDAFINIGMYIRTVSDNEGLADNLIKVGIFIRTIQNTVTISDVLAYLKIKIIIISDTIGLTDIINHIAELSITIWERFKALSLINKDKALVSRITKETELASGVTKSFIGTSTIVKDVTLRSEIDIEEV